jgi:phosphatidylserine/phosphatidylglycerophosphate/cardiolipin synthase-like enzyme
VKLLVQPDDDLAPLLNAVRDARKSIEMMIFRFDRPALEKALGEAVIRGVAVRALIAHTNSEGERALRKLELRLLAAGVTVARTADDLVRYHAKYFIVDRQRLFLLGFNFTALDISHSRSFGLEVRSKPIIQDVLRLFEADAARQTFAPSHRDLVVSPINARERLAQFIRSARRELLIYDPKLSDLRMIRLLRERAKAGVAIRILGRVAKPGASLEGARLAGVRLHVRAMVADGRHAFVGSQSLKRLELDGRRELGLFLREPAIVRQMVEVFEGDWAKSVPKAEGEDTPEAQEAETAEVAAT